MKKIGALFIISFLLHCHLSLAADFYYSPTGSGTECSSGNPCSLTYCVANAGSGNVCKGYDGDYGISSTLSIPAGVSLTAVNQTSPPSVRTYPTTDFGSNRFISLASLTPGTSGNQSVSYIEFDGEDTAADVDYFGLVRNRDNVTIEYCYIHDFTGLSGWTGSLVVESDDGTYGQWDSAWPQDPQAPGTETNLDAAWATYVGTPLSGFEFAYNTVVNIGDSDGDSIAAAIEIHRTSNSSIHDNTFNLDAVQTEAILGTEAWLDNVDIYNNYISTTPLTWRSTYLIELWCLRRGCEFYGNTLHNGGFSVTTGKETIVTKNTITWDSLSSFGYAVEFTTQHYGEVSYNFINNCAYIAITGNDQIDKKFQLSNVNIYRNVIERFRWRGIFLEENGNSSSFVQNIGVYHNTVNGGYSSGYPAIEVRFNGTGSMSNISIVNNISSNNPGAWFYLQNYQPTSLSVDNNVVYNSGAPVNFSPTNTISGNPSYNNPTNHDFSLKIDSVAKDAGATLGSPYYYGLGDSTNWFSQPPVVVTVDGSSQGSATECGAYTFIETPQSPGITGNGFISGGGNGFAY